MNPKSVENRIQKLTIPEDAKQCLLNLWRRSRQLVENILNFIRRHRHLSETLLLGAIVAYLLSMLPVIGTFLALVALVTAGAVGLARELKAELADVFGPNKP